MGKSVRNNGQDNGFDFDAAFTQATEEPPIDTKPKNGKKSETEKKSVPVNSGFDFDAAFTSAVKKKEETTYGKESSGGSQSQSQLPLAKRASTPFDFKREIDNGGLAQISPILRAQNNYENKRLTEEDIDVLAPTEFGQEKGLSNAASSPAAKKYFVSSHNGKKESDLIESVKKYLPDDNPEMSNAVLSGSPDLIKKTKDNLVQDIDNDIQTIKSKKVFEPGYTPSEFGQEPVLSPEENAQIKELESKKADIEVTFNQYAQNAIVNKRINSIKNEGTDAGLSPGMLAKEIGKQIEQEVLPNNYYKQREEAHTALKTLPLAEKYFKEKGAELPSSIRESIDTQVKTIKDNALYAKENIDYDRENIGLNAILQNISMKANDLISRGIATKNPDLINQGNDLLDQYNKFKDQKENLLDNYPDVGIAQTARILSDRISSEHGMRPIFISNSDIAKAAAAEEKQTGQFTKKYGKFINYVSPTMLPKGGLVGNIELGLENIGNDLFGRGGELEEIVRQYNPGLKTTSQSGGNPTKIAYDNEGKAYAELDNENYSTWDFNNSMRVIGHGLPELAKFVLLERGVGALAGLAGEVGVNTLTKIASVSSKLSKAPITAEELAATREALKFSKGLKETMGLTGAMYITSYDQNRKLADELIEGNSGKDEFKKDVLANAMTLISAAAFKVVGYSPSKAIQQSFAKTVMPDALKIIEKEGLEALSKEETNQLFKDIILPKAEALVKSLGVSVKGGAKGAAGVVLDKNTQGVLASIVNPEKGKLPTAQEDVDAAISQVMLMTTMGLPGLVNAKTSGTMTKDALYEAGLRYPQFEGLIKKGVDEGTYTQTQANEIVSVLKTMGEEAYKVQSATTNEGLPLTVKQKRDIAFNNFKVRAAKMLEEKGHDVKSGSVESEATKLNNEIKSDPRFEEVDVEMGEDGILRVVSKEKEEKTKEELHTEKLEDILNRVNEKGSEGIKRSISPENKQKSINFLRDQSLDTPNSLKEQLGGDEQLTIDIISSNPKEEIQKSIDKYESELKQEGTTEQRIEEIDKHLSLLDKGLEKAEISQPKINQNGNEETAQEGSETSQAAKEEGNGKETTQEGNVLAEEGAAPSEEGEAAPIPESGKPKVRVTAEEMKAGQPKKDGDMTSITHARMNELADEFGFPTYEKDPQTIEGWDRQAAERIKKDPDAVNKLMNKMRDEGMPSPVEQRMMLQYISSLRAKVRASPTPENLKELNRAKDISNIVGGRFVGQSLAARKGEKPTEDTLDNYLSEWTEAHGTETLPKETIDELSARYEKEQDLKLKIEEAYEKGRQAALKEKAEGEIKTQKKSTPAKRKSREQFVEERKTLYQKLKEQKEKHEQEQRDQGIHKAGFGITLTGEMAKTIGQIAKSFIAEGAQKLEEVIEKVHSEIKDIFPHVTKNDIRDVMAGVYKESKETKNDLAERIRNLEKEAKLLNQIEYERKGFEKTKTPSDKVKSNKRIEELKKRVDEVRKLKKSELEEEGVKDVGEMEADDLSKLKKKRLTQIANLREKIKTKDYSLPEPPPKRIKLDKEAQRLEDEYEKMKEKDLYQQEKARYDRLSKATKRWDKVWKALGLKRIIQTAIDFSIPLRQNITTTINPIKWLPRIEEGKLKTPTNVRQFKNMFAFTFVPRLMREYEKNLKETGEWYEMKEDGIVFSNPSEMKLNEREEDFRNNIFEGLRGMRGDDSKVKNAVSYIGEPIFASERAAAGALNTIRVERYRSARRNLESQGITRQNNPEAYKKMSEWVMNMTGRGKMLEMIENSKTGKTLAGNTFYGARLMASRFNLLKNPFFSKMPPEVRKEAFKDMAGYVSGVALTGLALMAAGGKVSFDPDKPDFLQVRFGDTKYDISGGMTAYIRTFLRLSKAAFEQGHAVGGTKSDTKEANKYSGFATRTGGTFITNKFAPNTAYAYHFLTGKSPSKNNKEFDPYEFFQIYPMYVSDIKDAWAEQGASALLTVGLPNIFGTGTQTYSDK